MEFITLTEDEFDARFTFIPNPVDGGYFWEHRQLVGIDNTNRIWSAIDGDHGRIYLIPGIHVVNVFGFVVTEQSHDNADIEVRLDA